MPHCCQYTIIYVRDNCFLRWGIMTCVRPSRYFLRNVIHLALIGSIQQLHLIDSSTTKNTGTTNSTTDSGSSRNCHEFTWRYHNFSAHTTTKEIAKREYELKAFPNNQMKLQPQTSDSCRTRKKKQQNIIPSDQKKLQNSTKKRALFNQPRRI
jgi:hypothetical protein